MDSLNQIGEDFRSRNIDSCFHFGLMASRVAAEIQYRDGQAESDILIAFVFYRRGLYAESLELLGRLERHYEESNSGEKLIRVYLDKVEVLNKEIGERSAIISLLHRSIQIGEKLEKDSILAEVYMNYVNRNPGLSKDSIGHYMDLSWAVASKYRDEKLLSFIQLWQTSFLIQEGKTDEALPLIKQLIAEAQRTGNINLAINAHFLMLRYYQDNPQMALEHCYLAYEVARKNGANSIQNYILTNALTFANQLGDKDEIIKVYEELERVMTASWENSQKFIGDYVRYNALEDHNSILAKENMQITLWLVVFCFLMIIFLVFYLIMLNRAKKAKAQISALNDMANMQIVAMEEAKRQAVLAEQQRLGQDLHDGLSSSIAAIKHQLEVLAMDADNALLKNKLINLQMEAVRTYEIARNKSHEWFSITDEQHDESFGNQIKILTDSALPDSRYRKDLYIDNDSLIHVSVDTRIALLRIIQEAITNVIKHAKARNVAILIYREMAELLVTITDDGRGMRQERFDGTKINLGLQSIRRRVRDLKGEVKIHSDGKGTEITVIIPLQKTDDQ